MIRRSYLITVFSSILLTVFSAVAFAQTAPVSGTVELDNNGTRTPVAGALIEVYRMDINSGFPSAKTDKGGKFAFAGMAAGALYVFSVSAPGCAPTYQPNVRAGQEKILITLKPGDGGKFTEAQIRDALKGKSTPGPANAEMSAEDKKRKEEYDRQVKEIEEKNKKIQASDAIAAKSNDEGRAALTAKDWDTAIAKFSTGVEAVPDYVGSTPVLLLGKMIAQKSKGFDLYRSGITISDLNARREKFNEANKFYEDALVSFTQALDVINKAPAAADAAEQKKRDSMKLELYTNAVEIHRIKAVAGVDTTKSAEAAKIYGEYIAMEPDPARKMGAHLNLGDIMRLCGDFEKAVVEYREVLTAKADHPEAMAGLGLSLFAAGASASPEDKVKEQEGLNYMQIYTEIAPVSPTDSESVKALKVSVKEAVDYLKSQKMAPQKVPAKKKP